MVKKKCRICGKDFNAVGNTKTCSELCRENFRKLERSNYYQKPEVKERLKEYYQRSEQKVKFKKYYQNNKRKISLRAKENYKKPEVRDSIKERQKENYKKPEVKARAKKYAKKYNQRTEVKNRRKELSSSPEAREKAKKYGQRKYVKEKARKYRKIPEIRKRIKEYKQTEKYKKTQRIYKKREEVKQKSREYTKRPEIKARTREYQNNKYKNDSNYKIKVKLRAHLGIALRRYTKTGKTHKSLKYGIDYRKIIEHLKPFPQHQHLYNIDHIIPLYSFNFINKDGSQNLEEIKRAFAPENHQWLLIEDHYEKGMKIIKQSTLYN